MWMGQGKVHLILVTIQRDLYCCIHISYLLHVLERSKCPPRCIANCKIEGCNFYQYCPTGVNIKAKEESNRYF